MFSRAEAGSRQGVSYFEAIARRYSAKRWVLAADTATPSAIVLRTAAVTPAIGNSFKRHRPAERGFTAFELPGKGAERDPSVVQPAQSDIAAQILDMHTIEWKQRIVGELISLFRKELVDLVLSELFFTLPAHPGPVLQPSLAEKTTDRQIHRMIGRDHVDTPNVNLLVHEPIANAVVRTGMPLNVLLLV